AGAPPARAAAAVVPAPDAVGDAPRRWLAVARRGHGASRPRWPGAQDVGGLRSSRGRGERGPRGAQAPHPEDAPLRCAPASPRPGPGPTPLSIRLLLV